MTPGATAACTSSRCSASSTSPLPETVDRELRRVEATDARSIVVDLSGLTFMDSTGARLVWQADVRSRADANRLTLRRGPRAVQRVFEISGVAGTLPFVD